MTASCATCIYARKIPALRIVVGHIAEVDVLACCCEPPQLRNIDRDAPQATWPEVRPTDWCGKFQSADSPEP